MDKVTTEILERLCNGDSRVRIAREMNIPEYWITEAVEEFNRKYREPAMDMFGNSINNNNVGMN